MTILAFTFSARIARAGWVWGSPMKPELLLAYLDSRRTPITKLGGRAPDYAALCEQAPELALRLLSDPSADVSHKRELLANLIRSPLAERVDRARLVETLHALPALEALRVIEALPERRINSARARELGLAFLIGHPQLTELAATRRQRIVRLLKHLLGERTWSSVQRLLEAELQPPRPAEVPRPTRRPATSRRDGLDHPSFTEQLKRALRRLRATAAPETPSTPAGGRERMVNHAARFLRRARTRYDGRGDAAMEALAFLAGVAFTPSDPQLRKSLAARQDLEAGAGLPRETLLGLRAARFPNVPLSRVRYLSAPTVAAGRRDGPLTMLYKSILFDRPADDPAADLAASLEEACAGLPVIEARLAVVLDLSESAASSGERSYHPAAVGLALAAMLRRCVRGLSVHQVGGSTSLAESAVPRPEGPSDLAAAVLEAARGRPEAILIITDGYENLRPGDTDAVVRGLRALGMPAPVYQVVPVWVGGEDLSRRRLGEAIPVVPVEHERGVRELLVRVRLALGGEALLEAEVALMGQLLGGGW